MYVKNIKEVKKNLRARYRQFRERMSVEQKITLDSNIQSRLLALNEYAGAETLFTYVSKSIEVDTIALIKAALANHKRVAVPRCVPDTYDMEFYYITSLDDLRKGTYGVMEPNPLNVSLSQRMLLDCVSFPGLALTHRVFAWVTAKATMTVSLPSFEAILLNMLCRLCAVEPAARLL